MYKNFIKRAMDLVVSLIAFIVFLPILIIVMIFLFFANRGKPFFFQNRPGKHGRVFKVIKFKTMNDKKDDAGQLLPDDERMTGIGTLVRKTSIDEIPQLLNVMIGHMSLIGPRPLLVGYLPYYNEAELERLAVRPGITGLTGVSGRNNISWHQKMHFDIVYVRNLSFKMDMHILLKTVHKVIARDGISKEGHTTTESFIDYCTENPMRIYDNQ
jgi:undecaprenyl phosphate N,N'-diacetylbacillosamine 1-phosphate transferase